MLGRFALVASLVTTLGVLGVSACHIDATDATDGVDQATSAVEPIAPGSPARAKLTFETGPVRPIAVSADGARVFVANTPNGSLDILRVTRSGLVPEGSVKVGLEPVAVAVRNHREVWVVNQVSDSVSIVDVSRSPARVVRTLLVGDEPRDIVFARDERAFITTAHRGQQRSSPALAGVPGAGDPQLTTPGVPRADVWVFDAEHPGTALGGRPLKIITLFGDTPRGLAVTPDGATVYAAIFNSGNQTTTALVTCPGVDDDTPCDIAGTHVPGSQLGPATNHAGVPAPRVQLIVKADAQGTFRDARGRDWSDAIKFRLPDQDVFAIDARSLTPTASFAHVGTTLFNLAVNPRSGVVYVSNSEARNDLRFEGPGSFAGTTLQGHLAESRITVLDGGRVLPRHLNKHIDYAVRPAPPGTKAHSLSTPLDMAVTDDGRTLYVAAFGSAKVGVFSTAELEADTFDPVTGSARYITVSGGGPSGLALDHRGHLFVATRFDNGVSMIDVASRAEIAHVALAGAESDAIAKGRRFLYDAQGSSSNGEAACASCHIFGDTDHLAWDLGNPDGDGAALPFSLELGFAAFLIPDLNGSGDASSPHPMKGPMMNQTLRGMVNHGPMHWRGDRAAGVFGTDTRAAPPFDSELAFKNFIGAYNSLTGLDTAFPRDDMQTFADFALSIVMPPNPVRNLDNSLTGAQARGRDYFVGCAGLDTITGQPVACEHGRPPPGQGHFSEALPIPGFGVPCEGCHTLRPGDGFFGTDGKLAFVGISQTMKVPQLRNLYTKVGMFGDPDDGGHPGGDFSFQGPQVRGFGFRHSGDLDSVFRFTQGAGFGGTPDGRIGLVGGDDQRRDVEQFVMAFDSDLAPIVGQQVTLDASNAAVVGPRIDLLIARAGTSFASKVLGPDATECDLVARGVIGRRAVTLVLGHDGTFRSDDGKLVYRDAELRGFARGEGQQITYTCLPPGWPH